MNVIIRASFKSAVSRGNSYNSYNFYSCEEGELEGGAPGVRAGLVNDGYQTQVSVAYYADHNIRNCLQPVALLYSSDFLLDTH